MALFGAPLALEDHAVRACYAALAMQVAMRRYSEEIRRTQGLEMQIRIGLHSGEVVVRAISNDLRMDYSAVGQTTHLAARMEQLALPGSIFKGEVFCKPLIIYRFSLPASAALSPRFLMQPSAWP
jgi:class 3 adenylate cyclase